MDPKIPYVISLGANCGGAERRVAEAIEWLRSSFDLLKVSSVYQTEAVGGAKGVYFNAVALIESSLPTPELDSLMKAYEMDQGRDEATRLRGEVPIDLDIVIEADRILRPWEFAQKFFREGYDQLK